MLLQEKVTKIWRTSHKTSNQVNKIRTGKSWLKFIKQKKYCVLYWSGRIRFQLIRQILERNSAVSYGPMDKSLEKTRLRQKDSLLFVFSEGPSHKGLRHQCYEKTLFDVQLDSSYRKVWSIHEVINYRNKGWVS